MKKKRFVFFRAQISYSSWWKRTLWQRRKKENKREEKIKKELECKFIRINPDGENYDIFVEIGKIKDYIVQSKKEAKIKEIKDKNKELKTKIKRLTTNQITNNFEKIAIKNW